MHPSPKGNPLFIYRHSRIELTEVSNDTTSITPLSTAKVPEKSSPSHRARDIKYDTSIPYVSLRFTDGYSKIKLQLAQKQVHVGYQPTVQNQLLL